MAMLGLALVPLAANAARPPAPADARQKLLLPVQLPPGVGEDLELTCLVEFGPSVAISALAFSSDGTTLFSGGYREVVVWDLKEARLSRRLGAGQFAGHVHAMEWIGGGPLLAVGEGVPGQSGAVHVVDTSSGKLIRSFTEPRDAVQALAISPDRKWLAAGSAAPDVYVWEIDTGKLTATLPGHGGGVAGLRFSSDGKLLASGGADRQLRTFSVDEWKPESSTLLAGPITDLMFGFDGQTLVASVDGDEARGIQLVPPPDPRPRPPRLVNLDAAPLRMVPFSPVQARGKRLYVACGDNTIQVLSAMLGGQPTFVMRGHADRVCALAISLDDTFIASGSNDGTIRLWTVAGRNLATFVQLAPDTDDFAIVTAPGFLTTSSKPAIEWRDRKGGEPPARLLNALDNHEAVCRILSGQPPFKPPAAAEPRARKQPVRPIRAVRSGGQP